MVEEREGFEEYLVGLAQHLSFVALGQPLNQLLLLGYVEPRLDLHRFIDVVQDLLLQLLREIRFLREVLEDLLVLVDLLSLGADGRDDAPEAADVVGEGDAADDLDSDDPHGFLRRGGHVVTEPHCQHDGGRPVVRPNVPLRPRLSIDSLGDLPVAALLEHKVERDSDCMREYQVEQEYFYERPIPLVVHLFYEQPLH